MNNQSPASSLTILNLYGKLRRSGANRDDACEKLRGLIHQLSPNDRKDLTRGLDEWDTKQAKKGDTEATATAREGTTASLDGDSPYIFGMSEYDRAAAERGYSALRPLHGVVICPTCGQKTDINREICQHCGNLLEESVAQANLADTTGQTWFGPDSELMLAINGAQEPVNVTVGSVLTLGRHTSSSAMSDVNLADYRAEALGVSRLHATIKRQNTTLTLIDMHSTNHTYLNGKQLADDEVCILKSGDEIYLAELGFTVVFKRAPAPQT